MTDIQRQDRIDRLTLVVGDAKAISLWAPKSTGSYSAGTYPRRTKPPTGSTFTRET